MSPYLQEMDVDEVENGCAVAKKWLVTKSAKYMVWSVLLVRSRDPIAPSCTWSNRGEGKCVCYVQPQVTLLNAGELIE